MMKDYIKLAFAKEYINLSDLELYREYDLGTDHMYLYYSKEKDVRDRKLYIVNTSLRTNDISIFQAKYEKFDYFRYKDL